mgnify:CR=1 FL=1
MRPAGPTDPAVPVVLVETDEDKPKPLAAYVNFAMHLDTVGGLHYSADYPFTLARSLAAVKGDDAVTDMASFIAAVSKSFQHGTSTSAMGTPVSGWTDTGRSWQTPPNVRPVHR